MKGVEAHHRSHLLNTDDNITWLLLGAHPLGREKQRGGAVIVPPSASHFKTLESASKYAIHSKAGALGTGLATRAQTPAPFPSAPVALQVSST